MSLKGVKNYFKLLIEAGKEFFADNVIKLSGSLAYYTVFSMGPLLLVITSFVGLFFEQETVTGKLYNQMRALVGKEGADGMLGIIRNMQSQGEATKFSVIGVVILILGATTVFADIQDSINYIWSIRAKPKKGWLKFLKNRLLSFSLVVGIGFLLIVSLFVNIIADVLTGRLQQLFVDQAVVFFKIVNLAILFVVTSFLFGIVYKVLPDARISWKDAMVGATFTGLLFLAGKSLIAVYLVSSDIANTYGAAASIIIMLGWVYYSSVILYFGAEFTKVYALSIGSGIKPYSNAVFIIKREAKELPGSRLRSADQLLQSAKTDKAE